MDEEGTVVYFENSPAAQQLKGSSLSDETEDLLFSSSTLHVPRTASDSIDNSPSIPVHCVGDLHNHAILLFGRWWRAGLEWISPNNQEHALDEVIDQIKSSPLLTEEDYHLLDSVLIDHTHHNHTPIRAHPQPNYISLCSLFVAFFSFSILLHPLMLLAITMAIVVGLLVIRRALRLRNGNLVSQAVGKLSDYQSSFDALLSQLSVTVKTVQEVEIVTRGYSRPSLTVPISRLDRLQGDRHPLQCVHLRKRVFVICRRGVHLLRTATRTLCARHKLTSELDDPHSYLSSQPLDKLHRLLETDVNFDCDFSSDLRNGTNLSVVPQDGTHMANSAGDMVCECLGLESLKDACSLLAVQNSELLRKLALLAAGSSTRRQLGSLVSTRASSSSHRPCMIVELSNQVEEICVFTKESLEQLRWSLEFHKNLLFGNPPVRSLSSNDGVTSETVDVLQPVADEVHCMDLKAQVTLNKIRGLGCRLTTIPSHDPSHDNEVKTDVLNQLQTIQLHLQGISEHVKESIELLQPQPDVHGSIYCPPAEESSCSEDEANRMEGSAESEGDSLTDDELVFEAYIPPRSIGTGQRDINEELEPDRLSAHEFELQQRQAKEVPLKMLKELNSVLAVRNVERVKKREERKRKRRNPHTQVDHKPSDSEPSVVQHTVKSNEDTSSSNLRLHRGDVMLVSDPTNITDRVLERDRYCRDLPCGVETKVIVTDETVEMVQENPSSLNTLIASTVNESSNDVSANGSKAIIDGTDDVIDKTNEVIDRTDDVIDKSWMLDAGMENRQSDVFIGQMSVAKAVAAAAVARQMTSSHMTSSVSDRDTVGVDGSRYKEVVFISSGNHDDI